MQQIPIEMFLAGVGITAKGYSALMLRHHTALSFGVPVPAATGVYIPLDIVAMRLMGELSLVIGRDDATGVILTHFDLWADAVGRAEVDDRPMFVCVAVIDPRKKKEERKLIITSGTQEEILGDLKSIPIDRAVTASVTGIVADIRARAKAIGYDLSDTFFPPPDYPGYASLLAEAKHQRQMALKRHRGGKKFRYHQTRKPVGIAAKDLH